MKPENHHKRDWGASHPLTNSQNTEKKIEEIRQRVVEGMVKTLTSPQGIKVMRELSKR